MLVVFHEEVLGGATISVLRLVPGLREAGWEPSFWVPRPSPLADELEERGLSVRGAPRPLGYSLPALRLPPGTKARLAATPGYLRAYASALRELRPRLVHANSLTTLAEASVARMLGIPVVMHVHEMLGGSPKARLAARAVNRIGSEVVAVSAACGRALATGGDSPRIVHECVPLPERPSAGSPGGDVVVGTVGVISRRKGSDLFVRAAERLAADPGIRFEMIGGVTDPLDAEWAADVLADARRAGVHHVERADVQAALDRWDLFVLPSRIDPFPIAMLEAMASGVAVVGARGHGGIEEMLADGAGALCPAEDPDRLADEIRRLAADPELRSARGDAARERVRGRYTLEHQSAGIAAAYEAATAS